MYRMGPEQILNLKLCFAGYCVLIKIMTLLVCRKNPLDLFTEHQQ